MVGIIPHAYSRAYIHIVLRVIRKETDAAPCIMRVLSPLTYYMTVRVISEHIDTKILPPQLIKLSSLK